MAIRCYGAPWVAVYLSVELGTLHNWCKKPPDGFVEPDAEMCGLGTRGPRPHKGWTEEKLSSLRAWYESRRGMSPDEARVHWARVDQEMKEGKRPSKKPEVPEGQFELF